MNKGKDSIYKLVKEYSDSRSIVYSNRDFDMDRFKNFKASKEIELFIRVLKQNFPNYVLGNFYHNLESLDVKYNRLLVLLGKGGTYNPITNQITIGNNSSIFHELFHMASTKKYSNRIICGFKQISIFLKTIGGAQKVAYKQSYHMINEGYTEIMTHRYFDSKVKSYPFNKFLAEKIEEIVGREDMEKAYLSNGTMILPKLLANFNNGEMLIPNFLENDKKKSYYSVLDFLNDTDDVLLIIAYVGKHYFNYFDVNKMQRIIKMLVFLYVNKLEQELNEGIIDIQEYDSKLKKYFEDFYRIPGYPLEIGGKPFIKKYKQEEYNKIYLDKMKEYVEELVLQAKNKYSNAIKV